MRIDMVSEHASPLAVLGGEDAGGQNVHVAALSRALAARGHRVRVYTRRDDPSLPGRVAFHDGVEVVHLDAGPPLHVPKDELLPHVPAMAEHVAADWARHGPPDVLHTHFWMSGLVGRRAVDLHGAHVPVVATFHALGVVKRRHQGDEDTSPPQRLDLERGLLEDVDAVVATCRDEVDELLALGAAPQRLHVVPCGVDLDRFSPSGPAASPWRAGRHRLLSLGRLVRRKGVDTAVEALALLPDAELVVAGGPAPSDLDVDPDVQRLRRTAAAAGVLDRVRFVGRVAQEEAASLLRGADVLVTVPWYEPFGIVPLEAMACGTPVVASAVGGMLDTVVDGRSGAHVPPRDPAALAARLDQLLADPATLRRMGEAGVRRARDTYSWDRVAAETEAVYHRLRTSAPTTRGGTMNRFGTMQEHLEDLTAALASLTAQSDEIEAWGRHLARTLDGGRLLAAGNGGSAAEAQHLTAELVGRFEGERRPLSAIVLHGDTSTVTAVCNDYGGDEVFARQVQAHGRPGDVLVLLSTSGRSRNLLCAAERARACGVEVWAMTGPAPNPLASSADRVVAVDAASTSAVQEAHLVAVHALCAAVERHLPGPVPDAEVRPRPEPATAPAPLVDLRDARRRLGAVR
jgi:glycosyltransferase involved in cell wall biosynthesis/phosphoheptose isomerase